MELLLNWKIEPVDGEVEAEELDESLVVPKAEKGCKVVGVVFRGVDGGKFTLAEDVAVNATGDVGEFSNPRNRLD